jgi:ribokinase
VVVGSVNADLVLQVSRLPDAGETMTADSLDYFPGGKGANQAAAAARLGWPTHFVGQVGKDANSSMLREALNDSGVGIDHLRAVQGPSGTAAILVQPSGENSILIVGGANTAKWEFADATQQLLREAGTLLMQREIPEDVNLQAAQLASDGGATVILDCGGADAAISQELLPLLSVLSPNETELARLTGMATDTEQQVEKAAHVLLDKGVHTVLVKLGSKGSLLVTRDGTVSQPIVTAGKVVDTTGAGDCFTAAFAVATQEGQNTQSALRFAAAAAGICVAGRGAMPSLPARADVDGLVAEQ